MKESVWGWWFMVLGLFVMAVVMLITDMTTTSEQDYYMIKEISEASMYEAVDYAFYREYGELRINSEKFIENFLRRFAEVITINKTMKIGFYDIYEAPPKVTVIVSTGSSQAFLSWSYDTFAVTNRIDAILEMYSNKEPENKPHSSKG